MTKRAEWTAGESGYQEAEDISQLREHLQDFLKEWVDRTDELNEAKFFKELDDVIDRSIMKDRASRAKETDQVIAQEVALFLTGIFQRRDLVARSTLAASPYDTDEQIGLLQFKDRLRLLINHLLPQDERAEYRKRLQEEFVLARLSRNSMKDPAVA